MWSTLAYAGAMLGIAVNAEALGLGGISVPAVQTENILFAVLLVAFVATACRRFVQR